MYLCREKLSGQFEEVFFGVLSVLMQDEAVKVQPVLVHYRFVFGQHEQQCLLVGRGVACEFEDFEGGHCTLDDFGVFLAELRGSRDVLAEEDDFFNVSALVGSGEQLIIESCTGDDPNGGIAMMLVEFDDELWRIREFLKVFQLIVKLVHSINHLISVDTAIDPGVLKLVKRDLEEDFINWVDEEDVSGAVAQDAGRRSRDLLVVEKQH